MDKIFDHVVKTDVGLVRKANEDAGGFAPSEEVCNNGDLFVVCDGMGGHVGGATASNTAVQSIIDFFKTQLFEDPYKAINDAIIFANEQIYGRAQAEPELQGMGTTATVLLIRDGEAYIGHVGDSRIYMQSDGEIYRITKDHSFVQNLVDQGVISDDEAESHPRKNELLKALGIRATVEPEVASQPIHAKKGDRFLMCSDGLCGLVDDTTMNEVISGAGTLDSKGDRLITLAKDAGGHDNITVALIEMSNSPYTASQFVDYNPKENLGSTGEIERLDSTQDLEVTPDLPDIPFWKQTKYQVIIGGVLLAIVFVILINPFGDKAEGDEIVDGNDTIPKVDSTQNKGFPFDTANYVSIIKPQPETPYTLDGAVNQIKDQDTLDSGGKFYDDYCLMYKGKNGKAKTRAKIEEFEEIHPNDTIWLDCNCAMSRVQLDKPEKPDSTQTE